MNNPIVLPNFLLKSNLAERLYHEFADKMPILDYHNHLPVKEIAENRTYENLSQIWLEGDHYKWRAMRANGIDEKFITGDSSDKEKFIKWAQTMPFTLRNPLYHWSHLELNRTFGIKDIVNPESAQYIYNRASMELSSGKMNVQDILKRFNVVKLCTTDDPIDNLEWHQILKKSNSEIAVIPAWRPDKAMAIANAEDFKSYVESLANVNNSSISSYDDYLSSLFERHNYFHDNGCRLSDHGLEFPFPIEDYSLIEIRAIFLKLIGGKDISKLEQKQFQAALLYEFARWNADKGWVQQFHVGALRNVNMSGVRKVGQACGFDSIADFGFARSMGLFFNRLEQDNKLAKTIVYNLNPKDNDMVASMLGNFQDGSIPGKMQFGAAWWFLDQKDGISNHINTLSNHGLLSRFVGMLTDSRSFLSFSRHEYFRRILCNILATDVENGEIPRDVELLGNMVEAICYNNAKEYFNF